MVSVGAVLRPEVEPERIRTVVRAAEESGLAELWLWEDCFAESGLATAAAALAWTDRLRVGVGILPTPLRNVALTAMEVATLDRLFPGRFTVGIGHGVQEWMAQVGVRPDSPLSLLREYATALRHLLAGDEVSTHGRYVTLDEVRLTWPPQDAPAVLAGATGPKTVRLTAQVADGTILTAGTSPDEVRRLRTVLDTARLEAGREGHHEVVVYVLTAVGPGAVARAEAEARRWGLDLGTDVLLAGDPQALAAGVQRWADAGADRVVLQPPGDEPDPEGFVRTVADLAPLLDELRGGSADG